MAACLGGLITLIGLISQLFFWFHTVVHLSVSTSGSCLLMTQEKMPSSLFYSYFSLFGFTTKPNTY